MSRRYSFALKRDMASTTDILSTKIKACPFRPADECAILMAAFSTALASSTRMLSSKSHLSAITSFHLSAAKRTDGTSGKAGSTSHLSSSPSQGSAVIWPLTLSMDIPAATAAWIRAWPAPKRNLLLSRILPTAATSSRVHIEVATPYPLGLASVW